MRVLMLGWEFPPFISGGLGTACFGLTKALSDLGVEILFVLPRAPDRPVHSHVRFLGRRTRRRAVRPAPVEFRPVVSTLKAYGSTMTSPVLRPKADREASDVAADTAERPAPANASPYEGDTVAKAYEYADLVCELAAGEEFDLVHAHDWMTFPAGMAAAQRFGRPLVTHVHATEFDRSGAGVNPPVYKMEREGTHAADRVVAVSKLTKGILTEKYAVPAGKIDVVYNAVMHEKTPPRRRPPDLGRDEKVVLFLGRITLQKGPEYFLLTARKLLEVMPDVRFVVAGNGDMMPRMVELSAELGIGHKVAFTGFLRGADVERAYRLSDVYVMPSVSEPFGITPLEAMLRGVPSVISKQSGVAEVVTHCLKVDFWDTFETANKLAALLRDPVLYRQLALAGAKEAASFDWRIPARRCLDSYRRALAVSGVAG